MKWDCERFPTPSVPTETFREKYPPLSSPPTLHGNPSVIQDMHGRILAWYLPDVLTERRQVYPIWTLFHVCCWLTGRRLGTNEKCITAPKPSPPTQPKHEYLAEQARGIQRSEGVSVVYSGVCRPKSSLVQSGPQGRSDVVVIVEMTLIRIVRHQSPRFEPHISASLKTAGGVTWATDIMETSALISGILSVCHPELYYAGL